MKRSESKKSHSWWWDSHISPKNSKWLQENLEDMEENVKEMLKLIDVDADSFARRAEMFYKKKPELMRLVEAVYRCYRALAERYDQVTGVLRKNIPTDLRSQVLGMSDVSSKPPPSWPSSVPWPSRRKSGPRASGFDVFSGIGGNGGESSDSESESDDSYANNYGGMQNSDESPTLDSESESDDSSVNYLGVQKSDEDRGLRKRIIELEVELLDVKEKFQMLQEEISEGSCEGSKSGDSEVLLMTRIAGYEEELKVTREKIKLSEEEIDKLKVELQKYKSMELSSKLEDKIDIMEEPSKFKGKLEFQEKTGHSELIMEHESKISALAEKLQVMKEKLLDSEKEVEHLRLELQGKESSIRHLQELLGTSQKDVSVWKANVEKEKWEVSKLQKRILKYKSNLSLHVQENRELRETFSYANKSLLKENTRLQDEITQLKEEKMDAKICTAKENLAKD